MLYVFPNQDGSTAVVEPGGDSNAAPYDRVLRHEGRTDLEYQLELNDKCFEEMQESAKWCLFAAPSLIHGTGLFTVSGRAKDDLVSVYAGERIDHKDRTSVRRSARRRTSPNICSRWKNKPSSTPPSAEATIPVSLTTVATPTWWPKISTVGIRPTSPSERRDPSRPYQR